MQFKLFLVAFLAVFSYGNCSEVLGVGVDALIERNITEDFQKLIEQLVSLAQNALSSVQKILNDLYDTLGEQAKEIVGQAIKDLSAVVEQLQTELEKAKEEALQLGEAAKQCVLSQEERVLELVQATRTELQGCRDGLLNDVRKVAEVVLEDVRALANKGQELKAKFDACSNIICKAGVLVEVKNLLDTVPALIQENVQVIGEQVQVSLPALKTCINTAANNYKDEILAVGKDIQTCLAA